MALWIVCPLFASGDGGGSGIGCVSVPLLVLVLVLVALMLVVFLLLLVVFCVVIIGVDGVAVAVGAQLTLPYDAASNAPCLASLCSTPPHPCFPPLRSETTPKTQRISEHI